MIKRKPKPKTSLPISLPPNNSGFTIVESLMAIVVVAILLAATAPVLVLSTAIRVQSRRIEKATQAANSFIDGIRIGSVTVPTTKITLNEPTLAAPRTLTGTPGDYLIDITQMPVPTDPNSPAPLYYYQKTGNVCSLSDPACTQDSTSPFDEFYIQAVQIQVLNSSNPINSAPVDGYRLAIRVYRSDVNFNKTLLASSKNASGNTVKTLDSPVVAFVGNTQAPLVERTVDVGNSSTTFKALCSRLGIAKDSSGNAQTCQ